MAHLIFGSPGRYIQGPGALAGLGEAVRQCGAGAAVIADAFVMAMLREPIAASCAAAGVPVDFFTFEGDVTAPALGALKQTVASSRAETIVSVGGGKCIDAGKAVVHARGGAFISAPTVASNDAPTSKNYVVYDEHHQLVEVGHLAVSPRYVIVDTAIIVRAPRALLVNGIGDALTKKFEAEQCLLAGGNNMFGARSALSGVALARECYRVLREHAEAALAQCGGSAEPDAAFEQAVEAVLLMSGLGFESGGLSIAHALTRGLSRVAGPREASHGHQVAYGLLVQLALERRDEAFFADLLDFYAMVGLPISLAELGADALSGALIRDIAEPTLKAPHCRNFERALTVEDFAVAIRAVEDRAKRRARAH